MSNQREFWCFISYRHADNQAAGRQWATWLHQQIETYEVPEDLVGTKNELGESIPERIFPVFRDEEELPVDADLSSPIYRALDNSKYLIVLCSPQAVESNYVAEEIHYFKKIGKSDRLLAVMIEGEPNAKNDPAKAGMNECFPTPLKHPVNQKGELVLEQVAEPIAADFRLPDGDMGWTSPEAYRQALIDEGAKRQELELEIQRYEKQSTLALLKIIAGILGIPLGTLTQRDKAYQLEKARKRARVFRRVAGVMAVLLIASVFAGIMAYKQRQIAVTQKSIAEENEKEAVRQRDASLVNQNRFLLRQADEANEDGDHIKAALVALNAFPGSYGGNRPAPVDENSLRTAIWGNDRRLVIPVENDVVNSEYSKDGKNILVAAKSNTLKIYDGKSGDVRRELKLEGKISYAVFSPEDKYVSVGTSNGAVKVFTFPELKQVVGFNVSGTVVDLRFTEDNKKIFAATFYGNIKGVEINSSKQFVDISIKNSFIDFLNLNHDESLLLVSYGYPGGLSIWETNSGKLVKDVMPREGGVVSQRTYGYPGFVDKSNAFISFDSKGGLIRELESEKIRQDISGMFVSASSDNKHLVMLAAATNGQYRGENEEFINSLTKSPFIMNTKNRKGVSLNHNLEVSDAFFSYDGKYLCTRSYSKLHIWDVNTNVKVNEIEIESGAKIRPSPNKQELLIYDDENGVDLVSLLPGDRTITFSEPINIWNAKFTEGGKYLVASELEGTKTNKLISTKDGSETLFSGICQAGKFRLVAGGSHVFVECINSAPVLWSLKTQSKLWEASDSNDTGRDRFKFNNTVTHVAYLERRYLTGADSWKKHTVVVLEDLAAGGKKEISTKELKINDLIFSSDGMSLVGSHKNKVVIVSAIEQAIVEKIDLVDNVKKSIYLSDKYYVYNSTGKEIIVYDRGAQKVVFKVPSMSSNKYAKVLENKNWLFTYNKEGIVSFWELATGELARRFETTGSTAKYTLIDEKGLLFSTDGDGGIWSVETGGQLASFKEYKPVDISLSSDAEEVLLAISHFGIKSQASIVALPLSEGDLIESVINILPKRRKCLTDKERVTLYMSPLSEIEKQQRGCL